MTGPGVTAGGRGLRFENGTSISDLTPWARSLLTRAPLRGVVAHTIDGDHPASKGSPRGHYAHNAFDYVPADDQDAATATQHWQSLGAYVHPEDYGTANYHLHVQPPKGQPLPPGAVWR